MPHQDVLRPKTKPESHKYQVQELLAQNEVPSFQELFDSFHTLAMFLITKMLCPIDCAV